MKTSGGDEDRNLPAAPVPELEFSYKTIRTGDTANVIQNDVDLGGRVDLIGVVGTDCTGEKLIRML